MNRSIPVGAAIALVTGLAFATAPARAESGGNTGPLPSNLHVLTSLSDGLLLPGVLVGFNPQPDPPGDVGKIDLGDPERPTIDLDAFGAGTYTFLFGVDLPTGGADFRVFGAPNSDHIFSFEYGGFVLDGVASEALVTVTIAGFAGDWVSFNPQPDPPGDFADNSIGFAFSADPMLSLTEQIGTLDQNGDFVPNGDGAISFAVPAPAAVALFPVALAALGFARRRRG
jgi:hypothetical protein